jgi:multicomponent Na+:H+ antiporter subunit E
LANLDVAYRVLHPYRPIEPGIVKVKTTLKSEVARVALANSITLTPGTMSVALTDDGHIYVHWIKVGSKDLEEATRRIVGRFEPILKEVFE